MKIDEAKRYKLVIGVLILVNVLIIAVWWLFYMNDAPDSRDRKSNQWHGQRRDFMEQALHLDSAQADQFHQLSDKHMKMLWQLNKEIDSLKNSISKEIIANDGNTAKIDSLFYNIAKKRAAVDTSIYHHFKRLRGVCRPDQVVKFDSLMNEFLSRKDRGPHRFRQEDQGRPQDASPETPREGRPEQMPGGNPDGK